MNESPNAAVDDILAALAPDGARAEAVEYLPGGYSNDNFRVTIDGEDFALRVARLGPPAAAEREFLTLDMAPDVVAYDAVNGHMLSRWIAGPLAVTAPLTVDEAIVYLRELHASVPPGIADYDVVSRIVAHFDAAGAPDGHYSLLETIGWASESTVGCHNDLNPWNIIRGGDGLRTLDWEYAGDNDPIFDVVGFGFGAGLGEAALEALMRGYAPSVSRVHVMRTRAIFQLRENAWALAQIAIGNDRPEIRKQRDACFANALELAARIGTPSV